MQQNGQFACHRDYGPSFAVLAAAISQCQSPSPQTAVRGKRSQDVLRSLHQQPSQMVVTCLRDPQFRRRTSRFILSRTQSQVAANRTTVGKALGIFQREHVGKRNQRPDTLHLLQQSRLRVFRFCQLLDPLVVALDLFTERLDTAQQRQQGRFQLGRNQGKNFAREGLRRTPGQLVASGFDNTPHRIHQPGSCCHQRISAAHHRYVRLSAGAAMMHRTQ
jgi:hypothetical protein